MSLITRTQDQEQKRFEAMQRRLESLERVREPEGGNCGSMMPWHGFKLEGRLAKIEETQIAQAASLRSDLALAGKPTVRPVRQSRQVPLKLPPLCPVFRRLRRPRPSTWRITTISMESSIWRSAASSISSRIFLHVADAQRALLVGRVVLRTKGLHSGHAVLRARGE